MTGRIDVHHHLLPPGYRELLREHRIADAGGRELPDWAPETTLAFMDTVGIGTAMHIRFILSHAGGFVPYASHRMAMVISGQTGRGLADVLDELYRFYFDTALSSTGAALPSLLAFARPGHVLYGSDWPFASEPLIRYFTEGLETYLGADAGSVGRADALALFPRLAGRDVAAGQPRHGGSDAPDRPARPVAAGPAGGR